MTLWHYDTMMQYNLHAQSPFMYIHNHYENNLKKLKFPIKQFYAFAHRFLSPRDLKSRTYHKITANSWYTAWLIQHIYGLPVHDIHYPKLDPLFSQFPVSTTRSDYFVFIGRLVTFSKQVDIIIQAFNESKYKLVIIGSGPDEQYLQSIAWPNIEFLGRIADPLERCEIIWNACWLVNITMESFGYVTAESVCLGTPVIGYIKWATPEIVDTESGLLIAHQDKKDLKQTIVEFLQKDRNYSEISTRARAKFTFSDLKFELK
jgi:glycosyltransferase involved in cell wall biosynthesis